MSSRAETDGPRTDAFLDQYLSRRLLARYVNANDPQYHLQAELLRQLLARADSAMELENVPDDIRDRVVQRILYGALDEEAALERMANLEEQQERLQRAPLHFVADPELLHADELLANARSQYIEIASDGRS